MTVPLAAPFFHASRLPCLQVQALRKRAAALPDDYLVVFVGDMVTEEALPTYMTMLNTLDGVRDETGASKTPWATWTRAWTAEENRHGDLMNKYIYLTGRVNMKAVEVTIQNLIGSGMDPKTENNPYLGFVYTSFQERATKVSRAGAAHVHMFAWAWRAASWRPWNTSTVLQTARLGRARLASAQRCTPPPSTRLRPLMYALH